MGKGKSGKSGQSVKGGESGTSCQVEKKCPIFFPYNFAHFPTKPPIFE